MVSAGLDLAFSICEFSENLEFQLGYRLQNVGFQTTGVALEDSLADVLGNSQQEEFTGYFDISGGQEADKLSIMLQLPEGTLCLDRSVYP